MKNKEFVKLWCRNPQMTGHCNNLSSEYGKLFSYNTCICQYKDGTFYLNITKYSPTTSRHQNHLKYYLDYINSKITEVSNVERNKIKLI